MSEPGILPVGGDQVPAEAEAAHQPVEVVPLDVEKLAARSGLKPIRGRRLREFQSIGEVIRQGGALSISRGMILVNIEDCHRADREIRRLMKEAGADLEVQIKLMGLKKDFLSIRGQMARDLAGAIKHAGLSDPDPSAPGGPANIPCGDISSIGDVDKLVFASKENRVEFHKKPQPEEHHAQEPAGS